ncbi:SAM-dependent methyltransferase [Vibrio cholerae]|uniref:SAM-dependent methyltransferase n=1 Tax=Vibrio cholerae TaxID=666 RepID=UPI000E6934BB|nr:SAM-dependent methyltransferase [Vibrio cholerae]
MKHINKNHNDIKNSTVYTPKVITDFLMKEVYSKLNIKKVFDPAIGSGNLVRDLKEQGVYVIGNDIEDVCDCADEFYQSDFEQFDKKLKDVDLVVMNPPFNGHPNRKLFPEIFIDKVFEMFESKVPVVAIVPTGWRINQRVKSKRWRKIRDNQKISSLITLPLDVFEGVQFHTEIVIFNIDGLEPHYFLDI